MTTELEVIRSAEEMIRRYRGRAGVAAARRANAHAKRGDLKGAATWTRVLSAIMTLQHTSPPKGSKPN